MTFGEMQLVKSGWNSQVGRWGTSMPVDRPGNPSVDLSRSTPAVRPHAPGLERDDDVKST